MISTVSPQCRDLGLASILGLIGGPSAPRTPELTRPGLFVINHWNFDFYLSKDWDNYWFDPENGPEFPDAYGVCDNPDQFARKYWSVLESDPKFEYVVSMVRIAKDEQSPDGGWRWHKWGEYVGEGTPTTEYLFDEPTFTEVYTFHVYRKPIL